MHADPEEALTYDGGIEEPVGDECCSNAVLDGFQTKQIESKDAILTDSSEEAGKGVSFEFLVAELGTPVSWLLTKTNACHDGLHAVNSGFFDIGGWQILARNSSTEMRQPD